MIHSIYKFAPTVQDIIKSSLSQLANQYWQGKSVAKYDPSIIERIYTTELLPDFNESKVLLLEFSCYLENYLWKNFDPKKSSNNHILSIVLMTNVKFRLNNTLIWSLFADTSLFSSFLTRVFQLKNDKKLSLEENTFYLQFLINLFYSIELPNIRSIIMKTVGSYKTIRGFVYRSQANNYPNLLSICSRKEKDSEFSHFLLTLLEEYFEVLYDHESHPSSIRILFLCKFVEFIIDLLSQLSTRIYIRLLLIDRYFIALSELSPLYSSNSLFRRYVELLNSYLFFEIDEETGEPLEENDVIAMHYEDLIAFKYFPKELKELSLLNVSAIDTNEKLLEYTKDLSEDQLIRLSQKLNLIPEKVTEIYSLPLIHNSIASIFDFLKKLICVYYGRRKSQRQVINTMALCPTEKELWNKNILPVDSSGTLILPLPKLTLHYLSLYDYLLRNFILYKLESTYQIKQDIHSLIFELKPSIVNGFVHFEGRSSMATGIKSFKILKVAPPLIGDIVPAKVEAEVVIHLSAFTGHIRSAWDSLKSHDNLFLLTIVGTENGVRNIDFDNADENILGISYVRGFEVSSIADESGVVIGETEVDGKVHNPVGNKRIIRGTLDSIQYDIDTKEKENNPNLYIYESFNVLLRRSPESNNFKGVLNTMRDAMNSTESVPDWLSRTFIGYEDTLACTYSKLPNCIDSFDFCDTILDSAHLFESFPDKKIVFSTLPNLESNNNPHLQYKIEFAHAEGRIASDLLLSRSSDMKIENEIKVASFDSKNIPSNHILATPYYSTTTPISRNGVRYTPTQIEAIHSGMNNGLTLIVGPPGTGKTDVAVQIISNLYHNFSSERILLITHSNHALNDLFEKISQRDINERYLLRLGHGASDISSESDFSKFGRMNYLLNVRLLLLKEIGKLATSIDMSETNAATCETSAYFFRYAIMPKWEEFLNKMKTSESKSSTLISDNFPFHSYFNTSSLFANDYSHDYSSAFNCWEYIVEIFNQLSEIRPFELLESSYDRGNYILTKHAKIVAMTCTHAALKASEFVKLRLQYDTIVLEEAAQIMDIETFIPIILQKPDPENGYRLKRIILLGDHEQLPPIIQNTSLQQYSHLEQSLFNRFIRLGIPAIRLDAQGRCRPSLAQLFAWRYPNLTSLPIVKETIYLRSNPGFYYDYQMINVEDFQGVGESTPHPFYYQNLGEAEYITQVYIYMRLLGYPASSISILTTYKGQKKLLYQLIKNKCMGNSLFGMPSTIETVDRYQGLQNDYVLLSLVRTKTVGYIRDIRRLTVALSRARLGLFIFCRQNLFMNCSELTTFFSYLIQRDSYLRLAPKERYVENLRDISTPPSEYISVSNLFHMGEINSGLYSQKSADSNKRMIETEDEEIEHLKKSKEESIEIDNDL